MLQGPGMINPTPTNPRPLSNFVPVNPLDEWENRYLLTYPESEHCQLFTTEEKEIHVLIGMPPDPI